MSEKQVDILEYRTMLFSIAYNMLGTVSDAEDIVQDTYASWLGTDTSHVKNPKFYLIRVVSNRCISHLKDIQKERLNYPGTWLPEPVLSAEENNNTDIKSQLSLGFLFLLEKLNPVERAVLILKEAFELKYAEIAEIFGVNEDTCRQHFSRARKKLSREKNRFEVDKGKHEEILHKFLDACFSQETGGIIELLREDVAAYADGGGKAPAILQPLFGRADVAQLLAGSTQGSKPFKRMETIMVNGRSCAVFYESAASKIPKMLIAIDVDANDKVTNIYYLANPKKLKNLVSEKN